MRYLLDTSTLIDYLRKKQRVYNFISDHENDQFITCSILHMSFFKGCIE